MRGFAHVEHSSATGALTRYWFGDAKAEGVFHPAAGIVHLLSQKPTKWTEHHERTHYHFLWTSLGNVNMIANAYKFEIWKFLLERLIAQGLKIEAPVCPGQTRCPDIYVEGCLEAVSRLDDFCEHLDESWRLTQEGVSDWVADRKTRSDSLPLFDSRKEVADLAMHADGLRLAREVERRFGPSYVYATISLVAGLIPPNPLDDSFNAASFFGDNKNRVDERFRALAKAKNVPPVFPDQTAIGDSLGQWRYYNELRNMTEAMFPVWTDDQNDPNYRSTLFIAESVPYAGVNPGFVARLTSGVMEQIGLFYGLHEGAVRILNNPHWAKRAKEVLGKVAGDEIRHISNVKDVSVRASMLRDLMSKTRHVYLEALLGRTPPLVIYDNTFRGVVETAVRPDISDDAMALLLAKDAVSIVEKVVLGKTDSKELDGILRIPCYMGLAQQCEPPNVCDSMICIRPFKFNQPLRIYCCVRKKWWTLVGEGFEAVS